MNLLSNNIYIIPLICLSVLTIVMTILYLFEFLKNRETQDQAEKITQEYKEKGWETIQSAGKQAQAIYAEAELEGIKSGAETRIQYAKLEIESEKQLNESVAEFKIFLQSLMQKGELAQKVNEEETKKRIDQMFTGLEERLSTFLISTEQKTVSSIELELKAARELIENYKTNQIKAIDENIVACLEQTLNLVLSKKLTLKDQLDLVYESLERAKAEKFVI